MKFQKIKNIFKKLYNKVKTVEFIEVDPNIMLSNSERMIAYNNIPKCINLIVVDELMNKQIRCNYLSELGQKEDALAIIQEYSEWIPEKSLDVEIDMMTITSMIN